MDYKRKDVPLFCDTQKMKDLKKVTPDYTPENKAKKTPQIGFQSGDIVQLINVQSLVGNTELTGEFTFDTYDKYDNTCYVYNKSPALTYSVELDKIKFLRKKK